MRITQKDIAAQLGINRSTVSRALRQDPRIPAATRKRVQAASRKLDYRPNSILSELAGARWRVEEGKATPVVAFISCVPQGAPYWSNNPVALRRQAATLGYAVESFRRSEFSSSAKLQRKLRSRCLTDIIIGPRYKDGFDVHLDWDKFICVQVAPGFTPLRLHSVIRNHFNTVTLAWQQAVEHGYRRVGIALIDHSFHLMDDFMRASAVDACQRQLYPDLPVIPAFHCVAGDKHRPEKFATWFKMHHPDVMIGFNASDNYFFRSEFGYNLPFACLHLGSGDIGLSGIPDDHDALSIEAMNLLHHCRRSYQWGMPRQRVDHVIEPNWVEGKSMPHKK